MSASTATQAGTELTSRRGMFSVRDNCKYYPLSASSHITGTAGNASVPGPLRPPSVTGDRAGSGLRAGERSGGTAGPRIERLHLVYRHVVGRVDARPRAGVTPGGRPAKVRSLRCCHPTCRGGAHCDKIWSAGNGWEEGKRGEGSRSEEACMVAEWSGDDTTHGARDDHDATRQAYGRGRVAVLTGWYLRPASKRERVQSDTGSGSGVVQIVRTIRREMKRPNGHGSLWT
ncbi:hypothetical protein BKA93DRAFT_97546 [Sparassis latifolia]